MHVVSHAVREQIKTIVQQGKSAVSQTRSEVSRQRYSYKKNLFTYKVSCSAPVSSGVVCARSRSSLLVAALHCRETGEIMDDATNYICCKRQSSTTEAHEREFATLRMVKTMHCLLLGFYGQASF